MKPLDIFKHDITGPNARGSAAPGRSANHAAEITAGAAQEVAGCIGTVDLETLVGDAMRGRQANVVKHHARIEKLIIESETAAFSGERAPVVDATRMVEQKCRLGIPDQCLIARARLLSGTRTPWIVTVFSAANVVALLPPGGGRASIHEAACW